ncbi:hypothetical protein IQ235_06905 [Oscillatoriales cyanobacterium LEGE 11467]|uniref:Uncharacterized protein n=1 Tax=Zarconia navalis LEGE 11467 TaxID=1828826 RepID=A0A928VZH6_9CYAN|nr:hypothetical protein [Zarconia navalis]MBE9040515.1 hypothetical protein [Zarconia navalis LEGE 11467]
MELKQDPNPIILVDTHVHIYDCFDLDRFLDSAWNNFSIQANKYQSHQNFTGILLLTENSNQNWFASLSSWIKDPNDRAPLSKRWTFSPTAETYSLYASNSQGHKLCLIAGRQIITEEKLEVLALMTDGDLTDGRSLEATIQEIQNVGGLPVLPWGVGKWLGKRGQLIEGVLQTDRPSPIFLGDNSGRPQFWSRPPYFQAAEQKGWRILPGTDPLPLAWEASRPGRFGLRLAGTIDSSEPGKQLRSMLLNSEVSCPAYGALETPWRFIRNQIALRIPSKSDR